MMGKSSFLFAIFLLLVFHSSLCVNGNELKTLSFIRCKKHELDALLKFKQSFTQDPMNRLSSWVGEDCCQWLGVTCDNVTHNVVKLNLRTHPQHFYDYSTCLPDSQVSMVSSGVSSALLQLKHLSHLDLSGNDFSGSRIPEFIGSLTQLRYLNLSAAGFSGPLTPQLGNLTNLLHLDVHVQCYDFSEQLYAEGLRWVSGLLKLESLDLSNSNLSGAHDTFRMLKTLPSLSVLSLSSCDLSNSHLSKALFSKTSNIFFPTLQHLDLGVNSFEGPLPSFLKNMVSLRSLSLRQNNFNGSVTLWLRAMTQLKVLDLSFNGFNYVEGGGIMGIMGNPCKFKHLDLSSNKFSQGDLLEPSMSLSGCGSFELEYLDLSHNKINGSLPSTLGQLKNLNYLNLVYNLMSGSLPSSLGQVTNLNYLNLANNLMSGSLPSSLGQVTNLNYLDLSYNEFKGRVPASFVNLSALTYLDLSNNNLGGVIPDFIGHLTQIEQLDISSNSLEGTVFGIGNLSKVSSLNMNDNHLNLNLDSSFNWQPPFQLYAFTVHSCMINTVFPQWLKNQTQIEFLDLSYTGISGELPGWLWNWTNIQELDLSGNQLTGSLPRNVVFDGPYRTMRLLELDNNLLTGTIPSWLHDSGTAGIIDLSSNMLTGAIFDGNTTSSLLSLLRVLDLSDNMLSGEIQFGKLVSSGTFLEILNLRRNHFNGPIHSEVCNFTSLLVLELADNHFTGHIPPCLGSMHFSLSYVVGFNDPSLLTKEIVKGIVEVVTGTFGGQSIIDFSSNNLVGTIPEELTNMSTLYALNLSYNQLTGHIPENIGNMRTVESLDLSNNHLSGTIPQSLSSIPSLSMLNLSHNHLHGPIPTGNQLQTLVDPFIYAGNSGLCGFPLPDCTTKLEPPTSSTNVNPTTGKRHVDIEDKYEKLWLILAVMSGVATRFWGVVGTLVIKRSWRQAYFRYVEHLGDRIYVPLKVRVNRLKRKFNENS